MAFVAIVGVAQATAAAASARDFATYQPSAAAERIEPSQAPKIDGDLSDAAWARAQVIDEFYQLEPKEGEPASERMTVRVLYDENSLYFAIHAFDREPERITASVKARDGNLSQDDLVRIYLDPYKTRRDGYLFEVNPLGARFDPNFHQAMYEVQDADVPEGTVVDVMQAGYAIGDRCLRPALVAVAKGGAKQAKPQAGKGPTPAPRAANDDFPEGGWGGD